MTNVIKGAGVTPIAQPASQLSEDDLAEFMIDPAWNPQGRTLTFAERIVAASRRIDSITMGSEVVPLSDRDTVTYVPEPDGEGHLVVVGHLFARIIKVSAIATVCVRLPR